MADFGTLVTQKLTHLIAKAKPPLRPKGCRGGTYDQSGRPDLNRGPPAPKAGAIPGYATPRNEEANY